MNILYQLMPDSLQNRISTLGEANTAAMWEVGRICVSFWNDIFSYKIGQSELNWSSEMLDDLNNVGIMDVYKFIGELFGKSSRRIREYADTASFYTEAEQARFEHLPFAFFTYAMRLGRPRYLDALELAMSEMDRQGGKRPSIDWLEVQFAERGDRAVQTDLALDALNQIESETMPSVLAAAKTYNETGEISDVSYSAIRAFKQSIRLLVELVKNLPLDKEAQRLLLEWLQDALLLLDEKTAQPV